MLLREYVPDQVRFGDASRWPEQGIIGSMPAPTPPCPSFLTPQQVAAAARRVRTHPDVRRMRLRRQGQLASILLAEIARTGLAVAAAREEAARGAGLTRARLALLESLARSDHACGMADLARRMHLSPQGVRRLATVLERQQLLEFWWHDADRRAVQLLITARGRKALEQAQGAWNACVTEWTYALETETLERTAALLRWLRARRPRGRGAG